MAQTVVQAYGIRPSERERLLGQIHAIDPDANVEFGDVPPPARKPLYKSKTFWINIAIAALSEAAVQMMNLGIDPVLALRLIALVSMVNVILRAATTMPVSMPWSPPATDGYYARGHR